MHVLEISEWLQFHLLLLFLLVSRGINSLSFTAKKGHSVYLSSKTKAFWQIVYKCTTTSWQKPGIVERNGSLICLFSVYPCETTSPPTRLFCKDLNLQNHPLKTLSPCIKLNDCLDVLWKIKWLEKKVLLKKKNTWRIKFFNLSKRIWTIALI